ncbi:MAG: twin transmembrane helix small protein [Alphaproteobacteria bacterium]|nr:twin transmembrane helix small protein [Alphaproteobacteria bacterium]
MNIFAFILMAAGVATTFIILTIGIVAMARGGEFNKKWSNRLMRYRIIAQAFAIAMFMLGLYLRKVAEGA